MIRFTFADDLDRELHRSFATKLFTALSMFLDYEKFGASPYGPCNEDAEMCHIILVHLDSRLDIHVGVALPRF